MFESAVALLKNGIAVGMFPSFSLAIGRHDKVFVKTHYGNKTVNPTATPVNADTLYDLASVTKILVTTMIALRFLENGKLTLYDTLSLFYGNCYDKGDLTIKQLMTHTSGLTPHLMLENLIKNKTGAPGAILRSEFAYETGTQVRYSCMGFILLGDILEKIGGKSLDVLAKELVFTPLSMNSTTYNPVSHNLAATRRYEEIVDGNVVTVDDENARFLGGVSGNAGAFSNIDDMIHFGELLSRKGVFRGNRILAERTLDCATKNYTPNCAEGRGLGFIIKQDALLSVGDLFSTGSFGHTGFTGTSIFVDKDTDLFAILLTNVIHTVVPERRARFFRLRRQFHNMIISEFETKNAE